MSNEISGIGTRGQLADAVAAFIQDSSTPRRNMILTDLDRGYRHALRRFQWPQAIRWQDAAVTVNGTGAYFFLPKDVLNLIRIINTSVPSVIEEYGVSELADHSYGFVSINGIPCQFARVGDSAVNQGLTANTQLEVLSDGTDTRTGFVEGILSGQTKRTSFTLNGTTQQTVGNWDEVHAFYVASTSSTRTVTLRTTSGATTLATIAPSELKAVYMKYRLWPVPTTTTILMALYKYSPPMILAESHEYIIPVQDYLFELAVAESFQSRRQMELATQHLALAEDTLLKIWFETRGHKTEQWTPSSPYLNYQAQFYVPVLGGF